MPVRKLLFTIAAVAVGAIAFACTPAKAPGSNPEDMTPAEHRAASEGEEQKAAEHEEEGDDVGPSKPNAEANQKAQHENEAQSHKDYAAQHKHAAEAAEQPSSPAK